MVLSTWHVQVLSAWHVLEGTHTAGSEGIFSPFRAEAPAPYLYEPPYVPAVLPTVGPVNYSRACFSKNPCVVRGFQGGAQFPARRRVQLAKAPGTSRSPCRAYNDISIIYIYIYIYIPISIYIIYI